MNDCVKGFLIFSDILFVSLIVIATKSENFDAKNNFIE